MSSQATRTFRCEVDSNDSLTVGETSNAVEALSALVTARAPGRSVHVSLVFTPDDCRALAAELLAVAERIKAAS
jgi:hypothetical protein